jgi:hypothetical protein
MLIDGKIPPSASSAETRITVQSGICGPGLLNDLLAANERE